MRPDEHRNRKKKSGHRIKSATTVQAAKRVGEQLESNAGRYADSKTTHDTAAKNYMDLLSQTQFSQGSVLMNDTVASPPLDLTRHLDLNLSAVISSIDQLPIDRILSLPSRRQSTPTPNRDDLKSKDKRPKPSDILYRNTGQRQLNLPTRKNTELGNGELPTETEGESPKEDTDGTPAEGNTGAPAGEPLDENLDKLEDWLDSVLDI